MATIARSNSASATKSRSLTASSELAKTSREAERGGGGGGVDRQRRPGQRAGAERRDVEALDGGDEPIDVAGERPAVGQQVVGQQHRLGPLHVRVAGEVGVAGRLGPGQQDVLRGRRRAGRPRSARACTTAAGRWRPGRCGCAPVCSLPPAGPASSVTRRSTAVWMSSSLGDERERVGGQLAGDLVERAEDRVALVVGQQPGPLRARRRGRASRRCRRATAGDRRGG